MLKAAIGTNDLGMHIVIRPISKALLSKDETVGIETQKINSLLTARRPIALADAISALPPLLPPSAYRIQILLWSRWRPLQIGAWRVLSSSW